MCIELRIKSKHLALEPQVIRYEEEKLKCQIKFYQRKENAAMCSALSIKLDSLINHRRWNVRNEARATELARAYLQGKPYLTVERRAECNDDMFKLYIIGRVLTMVQKYGKGDQRRVDRKTIELWSKI